MCDEKIYEVSVYYAGMCGYTDEFIVKACSEDEAMQKVRGKECRTCIVSAKELDLTEPYQTVYGDNS